MMDIEHDAVADEAGDPVTNDSRRNQVELVDLVADDQRVTGIVAALKAHDTLGMIGEPVNDLALALVAPLGAHDYDVLGHSCHCVPVDCLNDPLPVVFDQSTVAQRPITARLGRQEFDDNLALLAQHSDRLSPSAGIGRRVRRQHRPRRC
jgi:hypothetical protein